MTPTIDIGDAEIPSTIPINRHQVELLAQTLDDLDALLRNPLVISALRRTARPCDTGLLIDMVGFQALRLRQILTRHQADDDEPTAD